MQEKRFLCKIQDHLSFRSFRMRYVWKRDSRGDYENRFRTNGIIVLLGAREDIEKRDSTVDYWEESTRLQRGTRRLAWIPERTKNEGRWVGWQTNRLGFHAVSFNFLVQSLLLSRKQSCRAYRIYKSSRSPRHIIEDDEFREYHLWRDCCMVKIARKR